MNTEKPPSQEKKKRINRFSLIVSLGGFCALILVLMAFFFWPTMLGDATDSRGKIYSPRINTPTGETFTAPPLEDTKLKLQTRILSIIDLLKSSREKKYSIQIRSYPETEIHDATEFVTDLRKIRPDVHVEKVYVEGRGVWNRILVGHFTTFEEASIYMKENKLFDAYPGSFVKLTSEG